jgi:hypothetical protein
MEDPKTTNHKIETSLHQKQTTFHHRWRENAMPPMGGANMRHSNVDEEATLLEPSMLKKF